MKKLPGRLLVVGIAIVHCALAEAPAVLPKTSGPISPAVSTQLPAVRLASAVHAPLLAAVVAGPAAGGRIVAAGDHGVILLSDDGGKTFRQARSVPTQALLTCLNFPTALEGWAGGHDGVILHTADGGETWTLQHEDVDGDRPILAIRFQDARHGLAVGLFGTAVATSDGGATWTHVPVETGDEADHHLYAVFGDASTGAPLLIAGEAGLIYRSTDNGATWSAIQTSNPGSFWAGATLTDGSLLAVGQRGHVFASRDAGLSWVEIPSGTEASLTNIAVGPTGTVLITGLEGTLLTSRDGGHSFAASTRADRIAINASVFTASDIPLLFGSSGVMEPGSR